ncbi:hypothetical protein LZ30DRAFT_736408 [Colletotrichum cereale]|nr:hypothetical protein LZ30DRAFT_736408 [Colletotrichum cereale]
MEKIFTCHRHFPRVLTSADEPLCVGGRQRDSLCGSLLVIVDISKVREGGSQYFSSAYPILVGPRCPPHPRVVDQYDMQDSVRAIRLHYTHVERYPEMKKPCRGRGRRKQVGGMAAPPSWDGITDGACDETIIMTMRFFFKRRTKRGIGSQMLGQARPRPPLRPSSLMSRPCDEGGGFGDLTGRLFVAPGGECVLEPPVFRLNRVPTSGLSERKK